ncbi:hypothetical protein MTR_1g078350 [Medicago truncatula]|uniref:Uncharacterized protein n=1 Tax=Medicago truncatula TaxID=3880 RepID=A0A072VMB6_MEDTR|nr:hypothetical protein MTR_1g078350 [Medicago truncatula]
MLRVRAKGHYSHYLFSWNLEAHFSKYISTFEMTNQHFTTWVAAVLGPNTKGVCVISKVSMFFSWSQLEKNTINFPPLMSHYSASLQTQGKDMGHYVRKAITQNSPQVGFESTTNRLTADRSTTELLSNNGLKLRKPTLVLWTPTYGRAKKGLSLFSTYTRRKGYDSKPLRAAVNHPLSRFILINQSLRPHLLIFV